ncbi:DUF2510 domain-containing protein [Conexibacter woesei]|uniref:DUF2510 domain-containing protein n=1 Tax=Conexibacter woesei TaxID=191495 RepID=UPI0004170FF7|nr:DUF2510 domain-containing protein [Conexibacter woesei]
MPAHLSLPTHFHRQSPLPPLRTVLPGAAIGAVAGAVAGFLLDGVVAIVLLALAGALLVVALVAALPDRRERPEPPPPHHAPPAATPTTTLAVPPAGPDAPPGWYPDPDPPLETPHIRRLWDGERWTEHRWAPRGD